MLETKRDDLLEVVRLLPDVIFRCHKGPDGRIYWSLNEGGLAEEFHLTTREIEGRSLEEVFPPDVVEQIQPHFEAAFRGERAVFTNEMAGRYFRHYPQPVRGPDGKVREVVGFIADVTPLIEAERRLEAANSEMEAFAYAVSHDLRGPLTVMRNLLHLLNREPQGAATEDAKVLLKHLGDTADRMSAITEDLLQLSRVRRRDLVREPVDLSEVARQIIADLRREEPARDVHVIIASGLHATAQPRLVRQLLDNLLRNAWKYTSERARARIEFVHRSGWFEIRDNGVGFPAEDAARLFRPFQRLHGDRFPGTGIGLVTAARIVDRHNGQIEATGVEGGGATFRFRLDGGA